MRSVVSRSQLSPGCGIRRGDVVDRVGLYDPLDLPRPHDRPAATFPPCAVHKISDEPDVDACVRTPCAALRSYGEQASPAPCAANDTDRKGAERMLRRVSLIVIALIILGAPLALGACGGGASLSSHDVAGVSRQSIVEAFLRLPGARRSHIGNPEWLAPGEDPADLAVDAGCTVVRILISPQQVAIYQGGGDVATNHAGTFGVVVSGTAQAEPACLREAVNALRAAK